MRLKCIKLAGFKSFVDPTTINFPSNLCSVVGPNGCGKSNVIDAVRWVMGESSAKNLRGEHMTDVIFNGSSARKPVGQASVELVFDNHDHKLTGEYANFTEVSIKRRVDREAQSTYFLNGTKCRRKDITDIFLGTGLGARSYSIIEQGMVSRLIESKPEELRVYIEEAAGISKYKERRKETESRIKRTKENLERLEDIREELERQLQHLKRQSVAAEKYGELKAEERQTSANLNALRWQSLDAELKQNQVKIGQLEVQIEATIAEQRALDASVEQHLADNAELTDALGEVQARFYSLGNDIARIEQSIEHHLERVEQLKLDLSETEEGWEQTKEELDIDLRKITQLDAELKTIEPELETTRDEEQQSATELAAAETALQEWQQAWDEFNQRAEEPRQTAEVEQSRIQQLEQSIDRALERRKRLLEEQNRLAEMPSSTASTDEQQLEALEREVDELKSDLSSSDEVAVCRQSIAENQSELDQLRGELQTAQGKLASLEALQQAALGQDNPKLNQWLQAKGFDNQLRLAEGLRIDSGWELAVESVLGESLQAICIEGLDNLAEVLMDLPLGKLSFVDVRAASTDSPDNLNLPLIGSKVGCDWELGSLLQGIYAAENLSEALAYQHQLNPSESIVTRDGVWLGAGWIQVKNISAQDSIVERRGLIGDLFVQLKRLRADIEVLEQNRSALRESLKVAELKRESGQAAVAEKTRLLGEVKSRLSAHRAKAEEASVRRQQLAKELQELSRLIELEESQIGEARARLQRALDSMAQDEGGREQLESEREEVRAALSIAREKSRKDKDLAHELALRQQSVAAQLKSTRETMDRMASQVQRSKERIESLTTQIEESHEPLEGMRADLETLLEQRLGVEKELTEAKARVDENEHAMRKLEQERNEKQARQNTLRETLMQNRLKSEGATVKREALVAQLTEANFELEAVISQLPDSLTEAECEQALEKLGNRIQRLGPINLAAIDEYQTQSERKVYLDKQNEDLERALATLQNAIRKIDKETRTRFKETFDKINGGLQSLFPRIFGGGHAYLDMTGEDLLDTGVAIMARPPGKRNSTIHLLSGGEKAMTAIALVFSIFHLNPSPFCMLDEVDAPLDDANVGRYANLVAEMSANVQFIFVTHNKITMEVANQLLGVTMHEAGVSRIVAVDIDEAAELAAM
jgi:chromosome segregation protein